MSSSTPSTPRSTRAASPGTDTEMLLTPGRKIKAMLAAFDSDSDSDDEDRNRNNATQKGIGAGGDRSTTKLSDALKKSSISSFVAPMVDVEDGDDDEEEEEEIVRPKGRMAARLQGTIGQSGTTAFERVKRALRDEEMKGHGHKDDDEDEKDDDDDDDDDDDLPTAGPRRRGITTVLPEPALDEDDEEPRTRAYSPLFVSSPVKGRDHVEDNANTTDDEDEAQQPKKNARFLALVAQKRKEREAKEQAEAERRAAARAARQQGQSDSETVLSASEGEGDGASSGAEATAKKQQQTRPAARKASKKALDEMNRETQRMSRNMQLAHQAQTKKKITKESFFARFNFGQPAVPQESLPPAGETSSSAAGSQNSSDVEAQKDKETPRTSPVLGPADKVSATEKTNEIPAEPEFPTLEEILAKPPTQPEEPIAARMEVEPTGQKIAATNLKEKKALNLPAVRVRLSREEVARHQKNDSDSDLEIVTSPAKCRRIAAFENLPAKKLQESASMIKLKALAHLTSPNRKSKGMNGAQLSATLLLKARQQAARERQERIEELRAKGIHIETAEERAAMEDELENLVEKARMEADAIAKQERKAAKRDGDDDDEDEDFEYSGSEDGENGEDDEDEDMADAQGGGDGLVDSEADEGDESEDDKSEVMSIEETDIPTQRRKRQTRVISDDEDEDEVQEPKTPAKPIIGATTPGTRSVDRPHLPAQSSNDLLSLTQAFAGTIAGSPQRSQQSPAPTLPSTLPEPGLHESDSNVIIKDSQVPRAESHNILTHYASSIARVSESPAPRSVSNFSQIPDPTQDEGFILSPFDPSKRFLGTPQSTIETVIVDQNQSPAPTRSMRHLKRGGRTADLSMIEEQEEDNGDFEINANAFNIMKASKKNKKPAVLFDKSKSKAKDVVEEAAEESDDEYAGLGGGSDEDDDDEENAYDRAMINDHSGETVDEKQLAALNAHHQRTTDEKQVAKLLKDITTGALRRRRGANADDEFDLDDSDDELLARRREKQREFARMRKALLADEKMGEIAENPKKAAFFRAVEDRDDDDDDMGLEFEEEGEDEESQQDSNNPPQPEPSESQPDNTTSPENNNKRKRPLNPSTESTYNRPPPHLRRKPASAMSKKPATLAEIRETLSFLTETHEYDSFHEDASLDHEHDQPEETALDPADFASDNSSDDELAAVAGPSQQKPPPNLLTHHPRRTRGPVVDRLALLRQASSNSATSSNAGGKLAFATGDSPTTTAKDSGTFGLGFNRPPPLLRRSTTASSSSSSSSGAGAGSRRSSAASVNSGHGAVNPAGIKKAGGNATASVNAYTAARERERERELRMQRTRTGSAAGSRKLTAALLDQRTANRLGALGAGGRWE